MTATAAFLSLSPALLTRPTSAFCPSASHFSVLHRARHRPTFPTSSRPRITMADDPAFEAPQSNAALWAAIQFQSRTLSSAHFEQPRCDLVTAVWKQRDPVSSSRRTFVTTHHPSKGGTYTSSPPAELSSAGSFYPSPSRERSVRFTSGSGSTTLLEVWGDGNLRLCAPLPEATHGAVYMDGYYGGIAWSLDERHIAYIADMPSKPAESEEKKDEDDVLSAWAAKLEHKFDEPTRGPFGETYDAKRGTPTLFIADTMTGRVRRVESSGAPLGQPQWGDANDIVCVSTARDGDDAKMPLDLGIVYCYNRPMHLVACRLSHADLDFDGQPSIKTITTQWTRITKSSDELDFHCSSPRLSPDGKALVYIAAPSAGSSRILPHGTTKVLRCIRLSHGSFGAPRTIVGIPQAPTVDSFPGLYTHALPAHPWLDNDVLALTSTWGFTDRVLVVDITVSQPQCVLPDFFETAPELINMSIAVHDCFDDIMLISAMNAATPSRLAVVRRDAPADLKWVSAGPPPILAGLFKSETWTTLIADSYGDVARPFDSDEDNFESAFEILLIEPTKSAGALAIFPHGGPHSASTIIYAASISCMLARGFSVAFINYRGSLGLGQPSLESLLGRIGTQDVDEVAQATRYLLQANPELRADRTVFIGGSHSGFIGAHTSLITPPLYMRTVLRNPVTNIAAMAGASDIPDWCFAECGVQTDESGAFVPDADALAKMYAVSPVARVASAKRDGAVPATLLQVGASDKRVPPQQSILWKRLLTAAFGPDAVSLRWYPRSIHAIDDVPEGDDAWVHTLDFICQVL